MQKKAITSLLGKSVQSNRARLFMAARQASFHSSKAANVEVLLVLAIKSLILDDC